MHLPIPRFRYLGYFEYLSQVFSRLMAYPQPVDKGIGKQWVAKSDTHRRYLKAIPYFHKSVKDKTVALPRPV